MLVCNVVGARPNFMKIAPVVLELKKRGIPQILVHTGQHYDTNMSQIFFEELDLPNPDIFLGVGSDTHARQTARIMVAFEDVCRQHRPDLVIVGGDVNSTVAASLVAAKEHIPIAHVEAGLRSFDRTMPEEVNRVLTDHLSTLLFTTETSGNENLLREGIAERQVHFVGNCMVDSLLKHLEKAVAASAWRNFGLEPGGYALLTLHRPSNVDDSETLERVMTTMVRISRQLPILFPVHPRTAESMKSLQIELNSVILCDPMPYPTFVGLMAKAKCVLTDSGGVQEETTVLNIPCLTLRENTERPVTLTTGTNRLVGTDPVRIEGSFREILSDRWPVGRRPPLWDGKASQRIVDIIENSFHPLPRR